MRIIIAMEENKDPCKVVFGKKILCVIKRNFFTDLPTFVVRVDKEINKPDISRGLLRK